MAKEDFDISDKFLKKANAEDEEEEEEEGASSFDDF
mgnify:CR=1 FL=1